MSTIVPDPPPPPIVDSLAQNTVDMSQTTMSEKKKQDGNVDIIENEGAGSAKSKQASNDGMKNYFVSNVCSLVTWAKN